MFGYPRSFMFDPLDAWFDRRFGPRSTFMLPDPFDDLQRSLEATSRRIDRQRRRTEGAVHGHRARQEPSHAQVELDKVHHNEAARQLNSPSEEQARAWREHHEEMERAAAFAQPTEEQKAVSKAWDEYHAEMDRAREVMEPQQQELMESFMRAPKCHIVPRDDCFTLVVDVPGCKKEDVKIQLGHDSAGSFVTIKGDRKMESESGSRSGPSFTHRSVYGSFSRVVRLPANVVADPGNLLARYENGTIKIKLPKKAQQPKPDGVDIPLN